MTARADRKQRTLSADVYDRLRRDLLEGVLRPGQRLRFEELRELYDVGLSPLREALTRLAGEELVILEEHKGFRVAPISRVDLLDIAFMRKEIECMGVRLAIQNGDDRWEANVVRSIHELRIRSTLTAEGRLDPLWESRHRAFHCSLVEGCGSVRLLQIHNLLLDHADRYLKLSRYYAMTPRDRLREHVEIADAVVARDADLACALIKRHLERTVDTLLSSGIEIG
jgi:GntR family transcriptional regulator, carbon starvation induced regulator